MELKVGMKTVVIEPEYLKKLKRNGKTTYNPALYRNMYSLLAGKEVTSGTDHIVDTEPEKNKVTCLVNKINKTEAADRIKAALLANQEYVTHYTYSATIVDEIIYTGQSNIGSWNCCHIPISGEIKKHTLFSEFVVLYDDGVSIRPVYSSVTRSNYHFTVAAQGDYYVVEFCNVYDKNQHMLRILENDVRLKYGI